MTAPNRRPSVENALGNLSSRVARIEANRSSALPAAFVQYSNLGTITTTTLLDWSGGTFGTTDPSIFEMNPDNTGILIKQPGFYFAQVSLWRQSGGNASDNVYLTLWTTSFGFGNEWGETGSGSPLETSQVGTADPMVYWGTNRVSSASQYGGTTHPSLGAVMQHSGSNIDLTNLGSGLMIWRVGNMFNIGSV